MESAPGMDHFPAGRDPCRVPDQVDPYGQKNTESQLVRYILIAQKLLFYCLNLAEKHIGELPSSNGLLRSEEQSHRQPHGSAIRCCGGRARLEGTAHFIVLTCL